MAKAKKSAPAKTQAQRLLEATRQARAKGNPFAREMGKDTLTKQGRKAVKMG